MPSVTQKVGLRSSLLAPRPELIGVSLAIIIITLFHSCTYILIYFMKEKCNTSLETDITRKFSSQSPVIFKVSIKI